MGDWTEYLDDPKDAEAVDAWPLLTPEQLQEFTGDRTFAEEPDETTTSHTSGSTGDPKRIPYSPDDRERISNAGGRLLEMVDIEADDGFMTFGAPPEGDHVSSWLDLAMVDAVNAEKVNTSADDVAAVLNEDDDSARDWFDYGDPEDVTAIFGTPAVIRSLGNMLSNKYGKDPATVFPNVETLIMGGEPVTQTVRENRREQWGADHALEVYASTEMGMTAITPPGEEYLVPLVDEFVWEVLPEAEYDSIAEASADDLVNIFDVDEPVTGNIAVSDLDRDILPLPRYLIGDAVRVHPDDTVPRLEILGRDETGHKATFGGADLYPRQIGDALSDTYGDGIDDWKAAFSRPADVAVAMDCYVIGPDEAENEEFRHHLFQRATPVGEAYEFGRTITAEDGAVYGTVENTDELLVHYINLVPVDSVAEIEEQTGRTFDDGFKAERMVFADSY